MFEVRTNCIRCKVKLGGILLPFRPLEVGPQDLHSHKRCVDPLTKADPKAANVSSLRRNLVDFLENGAGPNRVFDQLEIVFERKLQATCARTWKIDKGWNEGQKCHRKERTVVVPRVMVRCFFVGAGPDEVHLWDWDSILTRAEENSVFLSTVSEDSCLSLGKEAVHLDCLVCNSTIPTNGPC